MQRLNGKDLPGISPLVQQVIDEAAAEAGGQRFKTAQAVLGLSQLFTKHRTALTRGYLKDEASSAAYIQYFLPVNLCKIQLLLDEMAPVEQATGRVSILDLGSGPGTGALAVLDWWHRNQPATENSLSVVAVDHVENTLRQAEHLWKRYCRTAGNDRAKLLTARRDLERPLNTRWPEAVKQGVPYDVIVLANCLNELHTDAPDAIVARTELVVDALSLLAPHGTMMIVEPALRQTSRALHLVRDRLLQEKRCTVYSPCLHERGCPALVNPSDWCHEERLWDPPRTIHDIDQDVGFIKDALKFSYLLLRKDGRTIAPRHSEMFRVVSELRILKGDTRAWLCNEMGRPEVGRLDRLRSETNAAWDQCRRGTIVKIEGLKRKGKTTLERIEDTATVEIVRPA